MGAGHQRWWLEADVEERLAQDNWRLQGYGTLLETMINNLAIDAALHGHPTWRSTWPRPDWTQEEFIRWAADRGVW